MQYIFYITYLNATTKIITTKIILKVWLVFAVHFNLRVRAARHLPPLFFFFLRGNFKMEAMPLCDWLWESKASVRDRTARVSILTAADSLSLSDHASVSL